MHILLEGLVVLAQEKIIPQKIIKNTIDSNNTASLLSFHKMQPDYIYCKYNIYIAFDYIAWIAVVITINCLFGTLYKSLWVLLAKSINRNKLWNVGETGGQESHCPGHKNVTFVEIWSFLADRLS